MENEASRALFRVDREIWVITSQAGEGRRGGLLATWVQQTSLDEHHPEMLIAIHPDHYTRELIDASGAFVAHLLRDQQAVLAFHFAKTSGRGADKLAGMALDDSESGAPRLRDCAAWVEARVFSRLATGDRVYYWANCIDGAVESNAPPLRESTFFASLSAADRAILGENRRKDVAAVAQAAADYRANLPEILRFFPRG